MTSRRAASAIGLPAVRPHELRHTGVTLAAGTGATTKELMRRLGLSSPATALLYQHAADDRDADIARALDAMLGALGRRPGRLSGFPYITDDMNVRKHGGLSPRKERARKLRRWWISLPTAVFGLPLAFSFSCVTYRAG